MDCFIITIVTLVGLVFHAWLCPAAGAGPTET